MKTLMGEPEVDHYVPADEAFQRERSDHVQAEAKACNINQQIIRSEIVEDIAKCAVSKGKKAGKSHGKASEHRDCCTVVCYGGETVESRLAKGAVN